MGFDAIRKQAYSAAHHGGGTGAAGSVKRDATAKVISSSGVREPPITQERSGTMVLKALLGDKDLKKDPPKWTLRKLKRQSNKKITILRKILSGAQSPELVKLKGVSASAFGQSYWKK